MVNAEQYAAESKIRKHTKEIPSTGFDEKKLNSDFTLKPNFYEGSPSESIDSGIYLDSWPIEDYIPLANGWVRCEDEEGFYYWHKNSGTVTRQNPQTVELCEIMGTTQRFAVNALGWKRIPEEELQMENSSRTVNRCIYELSYGVKDFNETVARWGEGKTLIMEIDDEDMVLRDPGGLISLHRQPICSIKVWGVGSENNRDFAYVAKNRWNNQYTCHVFRCEDVNARCIANAIRDSLTRMLSRTDIRDNLKNHRTKPLLFYTEDGEKDGLIHKMQNDFPTRINEPTKSLVCKYVGNIKVRSARGIATIQASIDELIRKLPESSWIKSNITISPSSIIVKDERHDFMHVLNISNGNSKLMCSTEKGFISRRFLRSASSSVQKTDLKIDGKILLEARIRYVSFIGVGKDLRLSGVIIHEADDKFYCHVLCAEPTAGLLCKTIEAACKLRYQKCLDAYPQAVSLSEKSRTRTLTLIKVSDKFRTIVGNALEYWGKKQQQ